MLLQDTVFARNKLILDYKILKINKKVTSKFSMNLAIGVLLFSVI